MRSSCVKLLAAVACGASAGAFAQQIPDQETGPAIVTVAAANDQVTMRDARTSQILIDARGLKFYMDSHAPGALRPTMEVKTQPSGFDVVYRFSNSTTEPKEIGEFCAGILTLGADINWWDFRKFSDCEPAHAGPVMWNRGYWYPDDWYSPVAVVANGTHAIGVSLHFPILEYKHDLLVTTTTLPGQYGSGEGGLGWAIMFRPTGYERSPSTFRPC